MSDQPTPSKSASRSWLPWLAALAFIAVAAVVVLSVYLSSQGNVRKPDVTAPSAFQIPAAHASDAFRVFADKSGASGMEVNSAIKIESKVAVSAAELKQSLRIVPAVNFDVQDQGGNNFVLKPSEALEAGKIYKISIATQIDDSGVQTAREFSFALQTAPDFKLVSTLPADHTQFVPQASGVEFKFTAGGWGDPSSFVSVEPATPGKWQTRGRVLAFVPDKPFDANKRYQVTVKKGFGPQGGKGLDEDIVVRFETGEDNPVRPPNNAYISLQEMYSAPVSKDWTMPAYGYNAASFDATFYKISKDDARGLLAQQTGELPWTKVDPTAKAYEALAKTPATSLSVDLVDDSNYGKMFRFPSLPAGFYLLNVKAKGQPSVADWSFVQVTNNASYIMADKNQLYVWMVNAGTNRNLSNFPIKVGDAQTATDASGLAKVATPAALAADKASDRVGVIAELGSGDTASFALLERMNGWYFDRIKSANSRLWGYLYIDRPLYQLSDQIQMFGLARDRSTDQGVGTVTLRLRRADLWFDVWTGNDKIYAQTDVQTDASGRFNGSLSWNELAPGYYTVEAVQNGELVSSASFEVREFAKPAYSLEVSLDKDSVYAGQTVNGTIRAHFFDGTPVPRAKVILALSDSSGRKEQNITLDENGLASFKWTAPTWTCPPITERYHFCATDNTFSADVRPAEGEQGEISASTALNVRSGNLGLDVSATSDAGQGIVSIRTWRHSFDAPENGLKDNWAGRTLDINIIPSWYEQVQNGFQYDPVEKKQKPVYIWQQRFDAAIPFRVTTDAQGKAEQRFPLEKGKSYEIVIDGKDDSGRVSRGSYWVWDGGSGAWDSTSPDNQTPTLDITPSANANGSYALGTRLTATVHEKPGVEFKPSEGTGVFFVIGSRGLQEALVESGASHQFNFEKDLIPNAEVGAVIWHNGAFTRLRNTVQFDRTSRALTIKAEPDKTSYAPGDTVRVHLTAVDKTTGASVNNVVFAYGAVDKALLALTYAQANDPLANIYGFVDTGIIFENTTFSDQVAPGGGGAEMGGGEGLAAKFGVRKNFKDTAAFGTVRTDFSGQATIEFQAPDNLTSWRFEIIGVSDSLFAGEQNIDIPVTKPLFVSVVMPGQLLSKDQPVIKLRAYGTALKNGEGLTYSVDAPTLGLSNQQVTGTAGTATYVAVDKLVPGKHRFTIGVEQGNLGDALEQFIDVADSRFTKQEYVHVDAAPGSAIPALGQPEASIILTSKTKAALLDHYAALASLDSARADSLLVKRVALQRLDQEYGGRPADAPSDEDMAAALSSYTDGPGFRLLPYGTTDLELSSEMAATAPDLVDADQMASYFSGYYDNAKSSSLERIEALSGLAALGEPVLPELQAAAADDKLDWRSQLIVARGLEAAGDRENASAILNRLLDKSQTRDNLMWLTVSSDPVETYEATADAAALASRLASPKAEALRNWVDTNLTKDAFPILSELRYLDAVLSTSIGRDVSLSYTLGDDEKTLTFDKDNTFQRLTLTRDEASRFRVTRVDGPVTISYIRTVAGRPVPVPELSILRQYQGSLANLREGDSLFIDLTPASHGHLQAGCYLIQDHLPAGMKPLINWNSGQQQTWYPTDVSGNTISFVECVGPSDGFKTVTYQAAVVSRGSYTAEAPVVSNMEYPSITAIGNDDQISIK